MFYNLGPRFLKPLNTMFSSGFPLKYEILTNDRNIVFSGPVICSHFPSNQKETLYLVILSFVYNGVMGNKKEISYFVVLYIVS